MNKKLSISKIVLLLFISLNFSCSNGGDDAKSAPTLNPEVVTTKPTIAPIQKQDSVFNKFGSVEKFEWVPTGYSKDFVYDIYYYIPTSIQNSKNSPALVFMHGGGASTMDRLGSNKAVNIYIKEVIAAAEKYKFIAILPSANGLNWGGHTQRIVAELAQLLRAHLNFDTNRLGLSGHSMGGMGITRTFTRVVNDYAFVNSISSAMNDTTQTEARLSKMYNIKYSHQLGLKDHFTDFLVWTKKLEANVKSMEERRGKKSQFEMEWFDDAHVYTPAQTKKLESLFKGQRNIFQSELYGEIYFDVRSYTENAITFTVLGSKRYLWLENIPTTMNDQFQFEVSVKNNIVNVNFFKDQDGYTIYPKSKKFKIYVSSKMFDLSKDIVIYDEGYFITRSPAKTKADRKAGFIDKDDPNSAYDDVIEFKLN
jgi:hypothetical protein